jgi:hypothetical protein
MSLCNTYNLSGMMSVWFGKFQVMLGLMLGVLLLGAVLAVGPVRGEEGDCPEFECPAKVALTNSKITV